MPTAAERQALAFLAAVALLGGGARAWSYYQSTQSTAALSGGPPGAGSETVGDQLAAIDSARTSKRGGHGKGGAAKGKSNSRGTTSSTTRQRKNDGKLQAPEGRSASEGLRGDDIVVDADVATVLQLQMLPRISPALAERIVANRDSAGAFGSLSALGRVRGMSVDIRNAIRNLVVFTGTPRVAPPRVSRARARNEVVSPNGVGSHLNTGERTVTSRTKKRK